MFLAHLQIEPGASPNRRPTFPTSLPATCSLNCPYGRRASSACRPCANSCCASPNAYPCALVPMGSTRALSPSSSLLPFTPHPFLALCSLWRRGAPWPPGGAPGWRCCCPSSPLLHIRLALLCLWSELTTEVKLLQPPETPCCRSCGPARTRTWAAAPDPPQAVLLAPVGAPGRLQVTVAHHCCRAAPPPRQKSGA